MTVTANPAAPPLLGNRFARLLAGTPAVPTRHGFAPDTIDLAGQAVSTDGVRIDPFTAPAVLPDLALQRPSSVDAPFESGIPAIHEIPIGFDIPQIVGTLFQQRQKIGTGDRPTGIHQGPGSGRTERSIASLLAALLPVLLPPAASERPDELLLPHSLYEFQRDGVEWLVEHIPGALLADDMGLGKTVQTVVALRKLFRQGTITRALIVAPKSVQTSWLRHIRDWAPELEAIGLTGPPDVRRVLWRDLAGNGAHIGVVTYQTLSKDMAHISRVPLGVLVVDEAQNIKNPDTARSKAMRNLNSQRRWALTGTPLENSSDDLASILNFVDPKSMPWTKKVPPDRLRGAASRLMLRRRKEQVLTDLPEVSSSIEFVGLLPGQREVYNRTERQGVRDLQSGSATRMHVLALITRLKQICNFVATESAKCDWLEDYLTVAQQEGDRVIVFSQYVETLEFIKSRVSSFNPVMYKGEMTDRSRESTLNTFREDPNVHVLLMSLKAGGTGLTITEANRVVHFDSWWNPATMAQATARVVRIGQTKRVFVSTLIAENSIEERIQEILAKKEKIFDAVVNDLSVEGVSRLLTTREIFELFGLEPPGR